ncbi:MAG: zinc finger domain-containing protein [Nitrospirota bacterium]
MCPINKGGRIKGRDKKAKGEKCSRCWNYSVAVGINIEHPTLCERCMVVVGT